MSIFVTGGTGLLGVNLVRQLVDGGARVRLLVRGGSSRAGLESDRIDFVQGDVTDAESVRSAMRGCDQVYHLAAWVQVSPWGWKIARAVNIEGTRNVCAAALALNIRRMVHTSSIATVASGTLEKPADEDSAPDASAMKIPYYRTKIEAEQVVLGFVDEGLDAVIVNPTYLVGPWDVKPSSGRVLIHMATHRVCLAPGRGGINYVDVRQAARGHILAMEHGKTGRRYLLGGENLSFRSFLERVVAVTGVPSRITLPLAILWPFAAAGSLAGRVFPTLFRDLNLAVLRAALIPHYVSSNRARMELGYEVASIDQAIADAIDWFVGHGFMNRVARRPVPSREA